MEGLRRKGGLERGGQWRSADDYILRYVPLVKLESDSQSERQQFTWSRLPLLVLTWFVMHVVCWQVVTF